jgi:site-specific DNA-methyltransferase (adenine-specific)
MISNAFNMDCMEAMKEFTDKYFELAIVDPPYGIGENGARGNNKTVKWKNPKKTIHSKKDWDKNIPDKKYFNELFRISKNQIIWGGNYMTEYLPPKMGWVFWDKKTGDSDYSDGELAWTSFDKALRKFEWLWSGFKQKKIEKRLHPTQKPVALYKWLLTNYAKQGDKILDTHLGSGSSRIAAWDMGFDFWGYELDSEYFEAQEKRFNNFKMQGKLF